MKAARIEEIFKMDNQDLESFSTNTENYLLERFLASKILEDRQGEEEGYSSEDDWCVTYSVSYTDEVIEVSVKPDSIPLEKFLEVGVNIQEILSEHVLGFSAEPDIQELCDTVKDFLNEHKVVANVYLKLKED